MPADYLNVFDPTIWGNQDLDFDRATQLCASSDLWISGHWLRNELPAVLRGRSNRNYT